MRQSELNLFETFCKESTYERNSKKYNVKIAFSQAYANCSITKLMAHDYFEMIHPWLVLRYAFAWSKDRYNDANFWKDINHRWEEFCIRKKIANVDEFNTLTVDELKRVTRELFGSEQKYGETPADAMDYFRIYIDEREDRKRKEKEAEEARLEAERLKHLENQKKHEEELRKKNEKSSQTINPVHVNSVIIDDDDEEDDDDYIILNTQYTNRKKLNKGEIRVENKTTNRMQFSTEESAEIIQSKLEYLCLKIDRATGNCYLRVCNDSDRGTPLSLRSNVSYSVNSRSKILCDFLINKFGVKNGRGVLLIGENESVNPNVLSYRIIGLKDA